jgi:hypothetical protein
VSKQEFATICIKGDTFHGDGNYTISPRKETVIS